MSIGLLVLRVVVGALFVGHGAQKLFGWFGGRGLTATARSFESLGYHRGRPMALLAGLAEAGGGLLLALGLITPLGAAGVIGVMLNAIMTVHARNGLWNSSGGVEFPLTNAAAASALAFTGPGTYSFDHLIGFAPAHVASGLFALVLGVVVGLLALVVRRPAPADHSEGRREEPHPRAA